MKPREPRTRVTGIRHTERPRKKRPTPRRAAFVVTEPGPSQESPRTPRFLRRGVEPILFLGPQRVQSCQHRDLSHLASSTGGCISEVQLPRWWYFVMAAPGNSPTCSNRASRDRAQASSRRFNFRWVFHPPDPSLPTYCITV